MRRNDNEFSIWDVGGFMGPLVGFTFLPFHWLGSLAVGVLLRVQMEVAFRQTLATCPRGHRVELVGFWTCGTCMISFPGHAWGPCPEGHRDHAVTCACALHLINPISPLRVPW